MKYRFVYSVLLIGLLSACGRAPQTTVTVPEPEIGEVSLTQQYITDNLKDYSVWLAGTVVNSIRSSGFEVTPPPPKAGLTAQQELAPCGFEGIVVTDDDKDTVPKIFSTTFKNCVQDKDTYKEVKNGDFQIEDLNDADAESGVRSRATNLSFDFLNTGTGETNSRLTFQDTWDFTITKSGDTGSLAYVLTLTGTKPGSSSITGRLTLSGVYTATSDNDANDFDNATLNEAGGKLVLNNTAAFNATFADLAFEDGCQASPTSGTLTLSDNTNQLVVTFTGCETVTYGYNGVAIFEPAQ